MPSIRPTPRAGLMSIQAYVPGKSDLQGFDASYKLSSNESPLGASRLALEAYKEAARKIHLYPDGSAAPLRAAIAEHYSLEQKQVVCGAGSDDLIRLLASAFLGPGYEGIVTAFGFQIFQISILAAGGRPVFAKEENFTASVDEILACVSERTKIVFLANPNNPTGTYLTQSEIARLVAQLPKHVLLVLDAAYSEYVTAEDYSDCLSLVDSHDNIVVTRTFSKIFGLAALRIGWAYAPQYVCDVLHRIRGPFNVSGPALYSAVAALKDEDHLAISVAHNQKWKSWLSENLEELGLKVTPSIANFILVHFPDATRSAMAAGTFLSKNGIIVRGLLPYGLPNSLRISIGDDEANIAVHRILREFINPK